MTVRSHWAPGRVQSIPEDVVDDNLRRAFSTPYSGDDSEYDSEDADEDTEVYEPEEQVPDQEYEPKVEEESHVHVPEPEVPVSAPVEVALAVKSSGRVRNQPERYAPPPQGTAYNCENGSSAVWRQGSQQHYGRAAAAGGQGGVYPSRSLEATAGTAEESYQVLHVP